MSSVSNGLIDLDFGGLIVTALGASMPCPSVANFNGLLAAWVMRKRA
jgi:hypothetical protein